ncbi:MAG: VOC family protein [Planctomycetes bacterium]|nr:VOC family protein [Planctomycetota bacterium]
MENLALGPDSRAVAERMEHIHLSVADVDRSADFYRRAFGFAVRYDGVGPYGRTVHIGTDRFYVALTEGGTGGSTGFFAHVGFVTTDLATFRERLKREGIEIAESASRKEGDAVYVMDPDGLEIEVVSYRPEYAYR